MDQQTLTNKYPTIHTPDEFDHSSSMNNSDSSGNKNFFRRVSSDTRLHIPHFLSSQDQGKFSALLLFIYFSSINCCLSSILISISLWLDEKVHFTLNRLHKNLIWKISGFHTNLHLPSLFENVAGFHHNNNNLQSHENMSNLNTRQVNFGCFLFTRNSVFMSDLMIIWTF